MNERALLDAVPCGIVVSELDENFTIADANNGYYEMMGYSRDEYLEKFGTGSFAAISPPEQAEEILELLRDQVSFGGKFAQKMKLSHKWRGYIWGHFSGSVYKMRDGTTKICFAVVDISEHLLEMEQLEKEHEYIQLMLALSDDAFFDFDVPNDTIRISSNFASAFGLSETIHGYPDAIIKSGIVAKESLHFFSENKFLPGEGSMEEVHLKLPNGEDTWYSIDYNVTCDENGSPTRVVGKIVDITGKVERITELREKAARDSLTKLYNKEEARIRIVEAIKDRRRSHVKFVLMMIDIDNFKGVNDTLGHQFGDRVLVDVAQKLRHVFRESDIVGRFGGDEFIVLLKNVESMDLIEAKAEAITDAFRHTFSGPNGEYKISGSVGVAICPDHGKTFEELYLLADAALYESKNRGKDCFTIYRKK